MRPPPRLINTLSIKLAIFYAVLFALSISLLSIIVFWIGDTALRRHVATRIDSEVAFLEAKLQTGGLPELIEEVQERMDSFAPGARLEYAVSNERGDRLAGRLPTIPDRLGWGNVSYPHRGRGEQGGRALVRVVRLDDGIRLAVADDLALIREIESAIFRTLWWLVPAVIALGLTGGLMLSVGFLRRIDAITKTAEAIIGGNIGQRIPLHGTRDELERLSATLNRMLDRISDLMTSLRQVSNQIAHDLRTPLTRLRNKLESARERLETDLRQGDAVKRMIADVDEILATFAALLRIAQVESGTLRARFLEVDLSDVFATVADAFAPAAHEQGKRLVVAVQPGLTILGDRELLIQLLANLIENAVEYTESGCEIAVRLSLADGVLAAEVADNGAGVPDDERQRIFHRHYRTGASSSRSGTGLGLALVAAIAELHEIEITAEDNEPGLRMAMRCKHLTKRPARD